MGEFFHFRRRQTAAIARANQGANACSSDGVDGNVFLFENFEDADMGNAASETPAERDPNGWRM
jgi:hypothetical protein